MKSILICLLLVAYTFGFTHVQYQDAFVSYLKRYGKAYGHNEFPYRFGIFKENMNKIAQFNSQEHTFSVGMNKFGDLTQSEFQSLFLGLNIEVPESSFETENEIDLKDVQADSLDWRTYGIVTPVKNQGSCGSCWAFSATGALEGCWALKTGTLTSFSEQELVDCSSSYGNYGCNGGLMTFAFNYIKDNGICTESSYPYTGRDGRCQTTCSPIGYTTGYVNVKRGSETDLLTKTNTAPVSVAIDASQWSFQFYTSGVYYDANCSSTSLDHGVLNIGYGTLSGSDYWLVKNSWGTDWGDDGYINMARNRNNNCGIATEASLPTC